MKNPLLLLVLMANALGLSACQSEQPDDHLVLQAGKALFEQHCAGCHSIEGQGSIFPGYPPVKGTALEVLDIMHRVIGQQPQNRNMPSFSQLEEADALLIARYVKTL